MRSIMNLVREVKKLKNVAVPTLLQSYIYRIGCWDRLPERFATYYEALPHNVPLLSSFFHKMFAHFFFQDFFEDITTEAVMSLKNSVLFNCDFFVWSQDMEVLDISVPQELFEEQEDFFRETGSVHGMDSRVIKIQINGKFAGTYLPEHNILTATDWTHSKDNIRLIHFVINTLENLGVLKKLPKENNIKEEVTITLGCDPEFEIFDEANALLLASGVGFKSYSKQIGCDGSGNQLELRPKPHTDPQKVVKNIKNLLKKLRDRNFILKFSGDVLPLGGHIHIGGIEPTPAVIELLDDFVGKRTIGLSGGARSNYKKLGSFEAKPWGFEYRTPPAAVFATPEMTRIVLKIVKNVLGYFLSNGEIEYNIYTDKKDYMKFCKLTTKEYDYFENFIKNYSTMKNNSLFACWKIKTVKTNTDTRIAEYRTEERTGTNNYEYVDCNATFEEYAVYS